MSATELTGLEALEQGVAAQGEGRLQDAVNFYLAILEVEPAHAEASHNLGLVMFSVGQVAESLPFLKKAVECSPDKEQFWISYVNALSREGDFEEARQVIADGERAGISFVNYNAATFFQGSSASDVDAGHKTQSPFSKRRSAQTEKKKNRKKLKRRSLQQPADAPQRKELEELVAHYQSDRLDEAKTAALEITRRFPSHPFAWKMLGAVLKALGRSEEALQPTLQSVVLAPFDAEAQSNLGAVLKDVGRYEEALDSLREAVRLAPDSAVAHYNLAGTLQVLEKLGEAVECYQRAIDLKPDYAAAHNNLGMIMQTMQQFIEAEGHFRSAIAAEPMLVSAHNNLGNVLRETGRLAEAIEAYCDAIRVEPNYTEAHCNKGNVLQDCGRLKEAVACFKEAVTLDPDYSGAHRKLANALQDLGQLQEAERHYLISDRLNPECEHTTAGMVDLLTRYAPADTTLHPIFSLHGQIQSLLPASRPFESIDDDNVHRLIDSVAALLNAQGQAMESELSQVYRRNSTNLDCARHLKIFDESKVIPRFCFGCYKVQVNLTSVFDLVKLLILFDRVDLPDDNPRKCMVEMRRDVGGFYKGFIYCTSEDEAFSLADNVGALVGQFISGSQSVVVKRGCSEFSAAYPEYGLTGQSDALAMVYPSRWMAIEQAEDSRFPGRLVPEMIPTISGLSLQDAIIVRNWFDYAKGLGDPTSAHFFSKSIYSDLFFSQGESRAAMFAAEDLS